jgi:hypothetical protein
MISVGSSSTSAFETVASDDEDKDNTPATGAGSSGGSSGSGHRPRTAAKTPQPSRLSKADHSLSQFLHAFQDMERRQRAADAQAVSILHSLIDVLKCHFACIASESKSDGITG